MFLAAADTPKQALFARTVTRQKSPGYRNDSDAGRGLPFKPSLLSLLSAYRAAAERQCCDLFVISSLETL
jgi:hypothetical protein